MFVRTLTLLDWLACVHAGQVETAAWEAELADRPLTWLPRAELPTAEGC